MHGKGLLMHGKGKVIQKKPVANLRPSSLFKKIKACHKYATVVSA